MLEMHRKREKRKNTVSLNRKGNAILDTITFMAALFVMAITAFIVFPLNQDINTELQNDPDLAPEAKTIMSDNASRLPSLLDGAFIFFFGMFWAFVVLASAQTDTSPLFFIFSLIGLIFVFIAGAELSNSFQDFENEADFAASKTAMPMTSFVMNKFLIILVFISASILIALYGKTRS